MFDFVKSIIPDSVLRAWVLATVRHLVTAGATALGAYLLSHHASQGDVTNIEEGTITVLMAVASYGFSLWDVKNVDTKIQTALNTPVSGPHYPEFNVIPTGPPAVPPLPEVPK